MERAAELQAAGITSVGVIADLTQEDRVAHALASVERLSARSRSW